MVKMDITDIRYQDEYFDAIYCSHVLEHVPDDNKAISEIHRVLKNDGWAILNVPITVDATFEDPSVVSESERLRLFGKEDHVRQYGPDYVERLRANGFQVEILQVNDLIGDQQEIIRMGLTSDCGEIFFCTKQ